MPGLKQDVLHVLLYSCTALKHEPAAQQLGWLLPTHRGTREVGSLYHALTGKTPTRGGYICTSETSHRYNSFCSVTEDFWVWSFTNQGSPYLCFPQSVNRDVRCPPVVAHSPCIHPSSGYFLSILTHYDQEPKKSPGKLLMLFTSPCILLDWAEAMVQYFWTLSKSLDSVSKWVHQTNLKREIKII